MDQDGSSPIVAWEANGYLGQYIVVVPKARLVTVRQVRTRDDYDGQSPWSHGYDDFTRRVIALAQTLVPELDVARQGILESGIRRTATTSSLPRRREPGDSTAIWPGEALGPRLRGDDGIANIGFRPATAAPQDAATAQAAARASI